MRNKRLSVIFSAHATKHMQTCAHMYACKYQQPKWTLMQGCVFDVHDNPVQSESHEDLALPSLLMSLDISLA